MDSTDHHAADQVPTIQIGFQLVSVELGGISSVEYVYLSGFVEVDR